MKHNSIANYRHKTRVAPIYETVETLPTGIYITIVHLFIGLKKMSQLSYWWVHNLSVIFEKKLSYYSCCLCKGDSVFNLDTFWGFSPKFNLFPNPTPCPPAVSHICHESFSLPTLNGSRLNIEYTVPQLAQHVRHTAYSLQGWRHYNLNRTMLRAKFHFNLKMSI
jgi:hypothetical protein